MGIVVIPGCGDIPGLMLRGVDGECYVEWDSVRFPRGWDVVRFPRGWDVVRFLWGRYINMSIFVDF